MRNRTWSFLIYSYALSLLRSSSADHLNLEQFINSFFSRWISEKRCNRHFFQDIRLFSSFFWWKINNNKSLIQIFLWPHSIFLKLQSSIASKGSCNLLTAKARISDDMKTYKIHKSRVICESEMSKWWLVQIL